jgi:hypothetical protein
LAENSDAARHGRHPWNYLSGNDKFREKMGGDWEKDQGFLKESGGIDDSRQRAGTSSQL